MTLKLMHRWRLVYTWTSLLFLSLMMLPSCNATMGVAHTTPNRESTSHTNVSGWQNPHPESMLQGPSDTNSTAIHYFGSKVDNVPSPKKKQRLQWRDIVSLMLTDIYLCELSSWLPKDTCGNALMILVISWSFINNSGYLLPWTMVIVILIINRRLW